ncbi:MAG: pyruvate oxidase [Streptosporangiaceae bacterium]|nr:pyruvate oxidase [Streptosporangiaceae bacterium]
MCLATSGPGAIHLLNGRYDAKLDHAPVLAITGMQETSVLGTGYQQEVHLEHLYEDVAEYNLVVDNPTQLPGVVDIAVRTALARRGVAHLSFPNDIQVADADADPWQHVAPARPPATAPGTKPGEELIDDCDTLFLVGTNFPYTEHLPEPGSVRTVQLEADPTRAGLRIPTEVPVIGDAKEGLRALLPLLTHKTDRSHLEKYQKEMGKWRRQMDGLENPKRDPIAPQYVVGVIDEFADPDAILTCDSGTIATWAARHWTIRDDREFYLSGNLATMAPGLPYAIAMQHAFPDRQVIAYVGDGGFSMLMAEFLTAVRAGLPIKVIINNNNSLGQILWEQMVLGYPEHGVRYPEPYPDFSRWAESCGGHGQTSRPRSSPRPS